MIPQTPRTTAHLLEWCHEYQFTGIVPQPKQMRFAIGIYQISQGMSWKVASPVRWQSFCAAAMHFIMTAEAYGIRVTLPETLDEIDAGFSGWDNLLIKIGKAQQQVVYSLHEASLSSRASRYDIFTLGERLYDLVTACFSLTPPAYREQGCFDEMKILTGDLDGRKK